MRQNAAAPLLLAMFVSCAARSLAPNVLEGPLPTTELIARADTIVVGTIESLTFGKAVHVSLPQFSQLNDCLAPIQARVSVENVLRGNVPLKLDYQYFGTLCGTMGPVELPTVGSRSVFFLHRERGVWRPLGDYWMNRIRVLTGSHRREVMAQPLERAIAEILLVPGHDCTAHALVEALATSTSQSANLIGQSATATLVTPLLHHSDQRIRLQACIELGGLGSALAEGCASRLLEVSLNAVDEQGFGAVSGIARDLEQLAGYANPEIRRRAGHVLPFAKAVDFAPPAPVAPLPPALR
jgi:hypothetical protein